MCYLTQYCQLELASDLNKENSYLQDKMHCITLYTCSDGEKMRYHVKTSPVNVLLVSECQARSLTTESSDFVFS